MIRLCLNRFGLLGAVALFTVAPHSIVKYFKGAEIITRQEYKYGAVEARIKAARGSGLVTAFFYWKHDSELPETEWQEQDFEIFGRNGKFQSQVMTPGNPRTGNKRNHELPSNAWEHYYTYRMEWTPHYLAFYIDDHLIRVETDPVRFAKHLDPARAEPAQIRLSLWSGNHYWSGLIDHENLPAATFVDYISVYEYHPQTGEFVLDWRDDFDTLDRSRWWFAEWTFEYAVNDYVPRNAAVKNGKLMLVMTKTLDSGQFPFNPPEDNPIVTREGDFLTPDVQDVPLVRSKAVVNNLD